MSHKFIIVSNLATAADCGSQQVKISWRITWSAIYKNWEFSKANEIHRSRCSETILRWQIQKKYVLIKSVLFWYPDRELTDWLKRKHGTNHGELYMKPAYFNYHRNRIISHHAVFLCRTSTMDLLRCTEVI